MPPTSFTIPDQIELEAQQFFQTAPCGYLFTDPAGRLLRVNRTLLGWLGYEEGSLVDGRRSLSDLISRGGRIYYETHFAPLLKLQGRVEEVNFTFLHHGGSRLPVLVSADQRTDAAGQPLFNSVVVVKFSQRKQYETELLRAKKQAESSDRAKTFFLSNISHEVLTPLNAIIGMADLLESTPLDPQQQRLRTVMSRSAHHLLDLFKNVLVVAKSGLGQLEVAHRSFDLRQLVTGVADSFRYDEHNREIDLILNLDDHIPAALLGDPTLITQLLTNLIGNAVKFTEKGQVRVTVEVSAQQENGLHVEFSVEDTGIGISPDQLSKLFYPFTQANQEIHTRYGGSGLGLSICQSILERYGSKMHVSSALGQGSRFSFTLLLPPSDSPVAPSGGNHILPPIQAGRVLLVEDNQTNAFLVSRYFTRWQVDYDLAVNGAEALELSRQQRYDLVLMDLQMPVLDGYDAARAIRALDGPNAEVPIVAFSASASIALSDRMRQAEIDGFLLKPFNPHQLHTLLCQHLSCDTPSTDSPPSPSMSFPYIREAFEDDAEALAGFSQILQRELHQAATELEHALEQQDAPAVGALKHKLKTSLHLLGDDTLEAQLERVTASLRERQRVSEAQRRALVQRLRTNATALAREKW